MTGYQRFVAYVYEYRKGKKGSNCGFIKVEVRDARCTMEVHLHCEGLIPETECSVYGFVRKDGLMDGVWLGSCETKEGRVECLIETDAASMGGSGIPLGGMGGVILTTQTGGFFGTEWDDQPVRPDNFREMKRKKTAEKTEGEEGTGRPEKDKNPEPEAETEPYEEAEIKAEPEEEPRAEAGTEPEEEPRAEAESEPEVKAGTDSEVNVEAGPEPEMRTRMETKAESEAESEAEASTGTEEKTDEVSAMALSYQADEEKEAASRSIRPPQPPTGGPGSVRPPHPPQPPEGGPGPVRPPRPPQPPTGGPGPVRPSRPPQPKPYPGRPVGEKFTPFPDDDMMQCQKIRPQDLSCLNRRQCALRNNRFLQYGYSNFGHLLLCRNAEGQYILGVPGGYDQQEKFMAGMFGFPYFRESPLVEVPKGRGGYWYRLIDAPDLHLMDGL